LAFFSPKRALVSGGRQGFVKPYLGRFLKVRIRINWPLIIKGIYGLLKILYVLVFKGMQLI